MASHHRRDTTNGNRGTIPCNTASLGSRDTTLCDMDTLLHGKDILRDTLFHGKDNLHDTLPREDNIYRENDSLHRAEDCHQVKGFLLRALDIRRRNSLFLAGNGLQVGGSR